MQKDLMVMGGVGGELEIILSQKGRLQRAFCPLQAEPVLALIRAQRVRSPRVVVQLPAELTKMRLLAVPAVNPQETAKLIAMGLAEAGEFQQKYLFDYRVIAQGSQQLLAVLYTTTAQAAPFLKLAARCRLHLNRLASLGDGLFAALQNGVIALTDGAEMAQNYGFFYEGAQESLLFLVVDGQLIHSQYSAGPMNLEQLGQAFVQLNGTLQRRYQLAKIAVGYVFLPEQEPEVAEWRRKQLAFFAEVPMVGVADASIVSTGASIVSTDASIVSTDAPRALNYSLLGLLKEANHHGL